MKGRVTNLVNAMEQTVFARTDGDQLASEAGPWPASTVSYTHTNRLRARVSLQQPSAAAWAQDYGYDGFARLNSLTSPAGSFGYQYAEISSAGGWTASDLVQQLDVPTGARIANACDGLGRRLRRLQIILASTPGAFVDNEREEAKETVFGHGR